MAALEFALVAPFVILLMLAGADLTFFMRAKMRLEATANQIALVVTQAQDLYASDFTNTTFNLFDTAQTIAGTTPVTGLSGTTIITGIVTDANRRQTIAWQKISPQSTTTSLFGTPTHVPTLPDNYLMPASKTLIAVEVFTPATPWVFSASLMGGAVTTTLRSYVLYQPRLGSLGTVQSGNRP